MVFNELPSPQAHSVGTHVRVRDSRGELEFVLVQSAGGDRGWTGVSAGKTTGLGGATGPRRLERRSLPDSIHPPLTARVGDHFTRVDGSGAIRDYQLSRSMSGRAWVPRATVPRMDTKGRARPASMSPEAARRLLGLPAREKS